MSSLRSESTQPITGKEQRISTSDTRVYDVVGSKPKRSLVTDRSDVKREVQCCKKSYTIGTWYVTTMNQDKLDAVKG